MKTTIGAIRNFIKQRMVEGTDRLSKMQPGTTWIAKYDMWEPYNSLETYGDRGVKLPVLWSSMDGVHGGHVHEDRPSTLRVPKGSEVKCVGRATTDQGWQDFGTSPIIEFEGEQYLVFSDGASTFYSPEEKHMSGTSIIDAMCSVLAKHGPMKKQDIMDMAADLKGLPSAPSGGNYFDNTSRGSLIVQGLVTVAGREGRTPLYQVTAKGMARVSKLVG